MPIIIQPPSLPNRYNLLELIQQVCAELAINRPNFVIANNDPQVQQMLAIANRLGRDLARQYVWQMLVKEHSFTTVDGVSLYDLPTDWGRQIPQTEWDRSSRWPLVGPVSDQQWQFTKSGIIPQGPRIQFRINSNAVEIVPATGGIEIAFNYVSKAWVVADTGLVYDRFLNDNDNALFEDSLMISGIKTQWKVAKGLDASFDLAEFRTMLDTMKAQDRSAPKLSMSPQPVEILLSGANIQDGNWPGN
jgi:hypothetical protein